MRNMIMAIVCAFLFGVMWGVYLHWTMLETKAKAHIAFEEANGYSIPNLNKSGWKINYDNNENIFYTQGRFKLTVK